MEGRELIAFLAMTMALSALGVDFLLPAFPEIRAEFGLAPGSTVVSRFITTYFVGLAAGQLVIGPLADRFGRRVLLRAGIALYLIGAGLTILAPTFASLLAARFVWGLGAAAGRVLTVAIVRDRFAGAAMARTISLVMAVFVTVPVVAPALGVALLRLLSWDQLVAVNMGAAVVVLAWTLRLDETLPRASRRTLQPRELVSSVGRVLRHPASGPLIAAQTVLFGGFASYLSTSEVVYRDVFERGALFPLLFGGMALVMGVATLVNSRIVERVGLRRMIRIDLAGYLIGTVLLLIAGVVTGGRPPLPAYLFVLAIILSSHAVLIPNLSARAMEPMGDIAGTASAVNGAMLIGGGALLGAAIDRSYDGTVLPLSAAMVLIGLVTALLLRRGLTEVSGTVDPSPDPRSDRPRGDRSASPRGPS